MKSMMYIALIALLLLVLAACGEDKSSTAQDSESAVAEAVQEAEAEPAAVEETAAEDEETGEADESHEMDEDDEAHSEEDVDTEADDAEDDDVEHDADMAEESGDDDDVTAAPSGEGWGESGTTAQSACDHPYMPMREGASWTYDSGDGPYGWEVTDVEGDLQQATAVILVTFEEFTLEYTWDCAEGEGISSFDFGSQGMANSFPDMTMELTHGEGAFLPPADEMVAGYSWDTDFEQTMTFSTGEGDAKIEATGDISTTQMSTILSANPVIAVEEVVEGVQVEQITDIAIVMNMMGTAVEQAQTLSTIFDMGWGVGIVNQSVQSEFGPVEVELLSYHVP